MILIGVIEDDLWMMRLEQGDCAVSPSSQSEATSGSTCSSVDHIVGVSAAWIS